MRKTGSARSTSFPESTSGRSVCLQHIGGSRFTRETNEIPSKEGEEEENICGQGGDLGVNKGNTQPVVAVETAKRLPVQLELRNEVVEEGGRRLVLLNTSTIPRKKGKGHLFLFAQYLLDPMERRHPAEGLATLLNASVQPFILRLRRSSPRSRIPFGSVDRPRRDSERWESAV